MTFTIVNFDSLNGATYNNSNTFNTYNFNTAYLNTSPNAFNATFNLQTPLRNVKRIHLKSIEIPIGYNNVRANSKTNIIGVATAYDSVTGIFSNIYSVSLADKTYSSITTLLADINSTFVTLYPSVNVVFSLVNGYITVASSSSAVFTSNIYVIPTNLAYMLGFRTGLNTLATRLTTAATVYMLNIDNYINMYISNLSTQSTHNQNGVLCHFKIITNTTNGVVYYSAESNSYPQSIEVNSHIPITSLNVVMTDRWGYSLNASGLDYSYTLAFES